jgi:hypothetical protein
MQWMNLNQRSPRVSVCRRIVKWLLVVTVALQLAACGGGGGGGGSSAADGTSTVASAGSSVSSSSGGSTTSASGGGQTSTSASGSVVLSWAAPVTRADGTPLSLADIDGYRIYYGSSAGNYTHSVSIADATTQRLILNNLASGTYYIVMTTYDVDGRESGYSAVVRKTVS